MASIPSIKGSDRDRDSGRTWTSGYSVSSLFRPRLNEDILKQTYPGAGTPENPYVVYFTRNDREDAMNFSKSRKWSIALPQAISFFAVTFGSSVYAPGIPNVMRHFGVTEEVAILGLALYVLGFAIGPILWAPMSEVYGRRLTFVVSFTIYIAFSAAAPCAPNITTLLILRFFASAFGSSAQTNPGGMIADLFNAEERGPATAFFAACPFLGPAFAPIVGGFVGETVGWRWILGVNAILNGVVWIIALFTTSETYAPVVLESRARALSRETGKVYVSRLDAGKPPRTLKMALKVSLTRPWILLFREPIVLLTGLYVSIVYATLYMFFAAIPIVFGETRGWSQGVAELPFLAVGLGVCLGVVLVGVDNKRYVRISKAAQAARGEPAAPETRLVTAMIGAIILPIGLFLFAWTTYPTIHWIAPVIGALIFACGLVMLFISLVSFLIDSYTVYVASALAANTIMRSFFATAFPLFTTQMYSTLGDQWASSVPAFLAVGCLPFPFLFYKYGPQIRSRCKYAADATTIMEQMRRHRVEMESKGKEKVKTEIV